MHIRLEVIDMKRRVKLSESKLKRIIAESVRRILIEADEPMSAMKNPTWLANDEHYFTKEEVPTIHTGEYSYPNYKIPNNYADYYDFDEDGLNGKTNISLTDDDSAEDAWDEYDGKQYVMHTGDFRFDDLPYVKRLENPNYAIPDEEIYKRIGNPSQYDTYMSESSNLNRIISKSIRKVLREQANDYEGNDLDYETIKMEAEDAVYKMQKEGQMLSWRSVAEYMGFRLETLNGDDLELLKDTIEEVMIDTDNPYWEEDMDFAQEVGEHNNWS